MITPNLMVSDMDRSVRFWRDLLGFSLDMSVDAARAWRMGPEARTEGCVFAMLSRDGARLALQTAPSLHDDLPEVFSGQAPDRPAATFLIDDPDPDAAAARLPAEVVAKPPHTTWYGMRELYLRDPDGHVVCLTRKAD